MVRVGACPTDRPNYGGETPSSLASRLRPARRHHELLNSVLTGQTSSCGGPASVSASRTAATANSADKNSARRNAPVPEEHEDLKAAKPRPVSHCAAKRQRDSATPDTGSGARSQQDKPTEAAVPAIGCSRMARSSPRRTRRPSNLAAALRRPSILDCRSHSEQGESIRNL